MLGQGGTIHDHRVQPSCFSDQRRAGDAISRHVAADFQGGSSRACERHAVDPWITCQSCTDIAAAWQELQRVSRDTCFV